MAILRQQSDSFDADSVYNVGMCLLHGGHSVYEQVLGAEDCQRCASNADENIFYAPRQLSVL